MVAVFVKLGLLAIATATGPSLLLWFTEMNLFIKKNKFFLWGGGGVLFFINQLITFYVAMVMM